MKVLISGAGVGGLTLAYWLCEAGHTAIVVEKSPDIRTDGYIVDFTGSGWDVANRMGVVPALREKSLNVPQIAYVDGSGHLTAHASLDKVLRAGRIFDKYFALNHRDLVEVLYEAVKDRAAVRFGTSVESICQSPDHVTASFTGNQPDETFDLVVGADGIHSNVRGLTFGDESEFDEYLGYYVAVFRTTHVPSDIPPGYVMYLETGLQFGVFPDKAGGWMAFILYKSENEGYIPHDKRLETLRRHIPHAGWIVEDVLNHVEPDEPIFMDTVTQIRMPKWSSNRVALVGDAGYCLTLISGQGASMAMAGAYFLSQELNRTSDYHQAFAAYEKRLRSHIEKAQDKARNFAPTFVPSSQLRITITNWAVRLMDLPPVSKLVGKQFSAESIIGA